MGLANRSRGSRPHGAARLPGIIALTAAVTAVAAGILWWWGGRERRRRERLAAMQKALGAEQGVEP